MVYRRRNYANFYLSGETGENRFFRGFLANCDCVLCLDCAIISTRNQIMNINPTTIENAYYYAVIITIAAVLLVYFLVLRKERKRRE